MPNGSEIVIGIDVGGTFTDMLALDRGEGAIISAFKIPTTPDDPALGGICSVDRFMENTGEKVDAIFHGTTVGTNALITKRAAKTALITTAGFRDVLTLRRHARPRLYDLSPKISPPLVPRERRFEVTERMSPEGVPIIPLENGAIDRLIQNIESCGAEAVAISFLHAYANDSHEKIIGTALKSVLPDLFITLSSDVCREFREFERTSTTVVNAFIGPSVQRYLHNLSINLNDREIAHLSIVKSNGGLTSSINAIRYPVHLIESGPAAGIIAAAALGSAEKIDNLIAFDMGGTTAKTGVIIDGNPKLSTEFYADRFVDGIDAGGYPIQSPVIDLIEIGAGGGSIAWLDNAGVIKVGPDSAGADPGPACYGRGGRYPTVTDAHVVLGHITAKGIQSADLNFNSAAAREAVETQIANPLGWTVERASYGILRLATTNMAEMVRLATLRRGLDPRDFSLIAFGGAGPLHAAEIAREVGVPRVVIPPVPGLFSAIGTMMGNVRHDLVQTHLRQLKQLRTNELEAGFYALERRAQVLIEAEKGIQTWRLDRSVDARYEGQLFELNLPCAREMALTKEELQLSFRAAYRESYGYELPSHSVQLVNLRLVVTGEIHDGTWPKNYRVKETTSAHTRTILRENGEAEEVVVWSRNSLKSKQRYHGPIIVEDFGSTIRLLERQKLEVLPSGTITISEERSSE